MKGRLVAALVAVLVTVGCGGGPATFGPAGPQWSPIARTLSGALELGDANPCNAGSPACVQAVAEEMTRRFVPLARSCSHEAPFALMYLRVTQAVEHAEPGQFADRAYLAHLDALFAQLYFSASSAWGRGAEDEVPRAWQLAFRAADDGTVSALGNMLLGMNAHISHDLPFAVAAAGVSAAHHADFDRVNAVLVDVQQPMVDEASARWDPAIGTFRLPAIGEPVDIGTIISRWRDEAWHNGERLAAATNRRERAAIVAQIDKVADNRALLIRAATGYLDLRLDTAGRDAHCRSQPDRSDTSWTAFVAVRAS